MNDLVRESELLATARPMPTHQEFEDGTEFEIKAAIETLRRHFMPRHLIGERLTLESMFFHTYRAYRSKGIDYPDTHPYMRERLTADLDSFRLGRGYLPHYMVIVYHRIIHAAAH